MAMSFLTKLAFLVMACIMAALAMVPKTLAHHNSQYDYIEPHNYARQQVNVGPVTWDQNLEQYAQHYAKERKGDCELIPSGGPYGENLFRSYNKDYAARDAVASWLAEKQYYNHPNNTCAPGKQCGHYTQCVWRSSTSIGCAMMKCKTGGIFVICNYKPRGNIIGQRPY